MVETENNNDLEEEYLQICLDLVKLLTEKAPKSTVSIKKIREQLQIHRNHLECKSPYRESALKN